MTSILDQDFGNDDSDEGEDFNPAPEGDSDAEEADSDDGKPARANDRTEARREKSRTPGRSRNDANGNDSTDPARANGRPARDEDEEDNGEDDEGEGEDLNGDDDEEDEEDDEDEDIASVSPMIFGYNESYVKTLKNYSHDPENGGGEVSTSSSRRKPKSMKTTTMSKTMRKTLSRTASWQTHIPMILKS